MRAQERLVVPAEGVQGARAAGRPGVRFGPPGGAGESSIFFVGTATVILRHAGFTILTDPNFLHAGDHVHLGYGLGAERLTNPAIELDQLPPIDLVVLSHLHGDHFDRIVARDLDKALPILAPPSAARMLRRMGFSAARGLDTWEAIDVEKGAARLRITAMPGRHGPPVVGELLPEVMGSILDFPRPAGQDLRVYISGDTLVYEQLHEIPRRYPGIDIALLHLGGMRILGVLVTMDARQGVEAIRIVMPKQVIPIHYDDYTVFKSPLADFLREVQRAGLAGKVHVLARGETFVIEPDRIRAGAG